MEPIIQTEDTVQLLRRAVRFPVELNPPPGFDPEELSTWPQVDGRLEYVGGRLLYMPPCGDEQGDVAVDVVFVLRLWSRQHPDFRVSGNEIGMRLGGDTRGAEAAIWRLDTLTPNSGGFRRVPPVLAVEVAGLDEAEAKLLEKAAWYLQHGVRCVWLVFPETREVVAVTQAGTRRLRWGERMPPHDGLPGLEPEVSEFFSQIGPPA